jgi:predicted transcriptional regulator
MPVFMQYLNNTVTTLILISINIEGSRLDYASPLRSKLKLKILLSLLEEEHNIGELTARVGSRNTTILHVLKEFGNLKLLTKTDRGYKLTSLGNMQAQICKEITSTMEVVENFKDFWLRHDLTGIPKHLLLNIGALKSSTIIQTEALQLKTVHNTFMEIATTSKKIKGISPIFHPDFISLFSQLLEKEAAIDIIITDSILQKIMEQADLKTLNRFIEKQSLKINICNDLKVALLLTESIISLGLFFLSGEYDDNSDLISNSKEAIKWGEQLYEETLRKSVPLKLDTLI